MGRGWLHFMHASSLAQDLGYVDSSLLALSAMLWIASGCAQCHQDCLDPVAG